MTRKRMFPTLSVAAACALGAGPIASASAATDVQQATSGNWSGYVVGAGSDSGSSGAATTFKTVTGSWVQPTAKCSSGGATYSAFWVGLGGADGQQALEQAGTEANCGANGTAHYYAWYELVPKAPVRVDLAVHPGDHMTATTTVEGHDVTETIVNHTTGQSFAKTLTMSNPDVSTAEWIAEAPSQCQGGASNCTALPLSNFGTVSFTSASATDSSGHAGTISSGGWGTAALTLDSSDSSSAGSIPAGYGYGYGYGSGQPVSSAASGSASPSGLTDGGSAFTVSYRRASSVSSGSGSSYGYGGSGSGSGSGSGGYGYPGGSGGYGYPGGSGYGSPGGYGYPGGYGSSGGYGYSGGYGDGGYIVIYGY